MGTESGHIRHQQREYWDRDQGDRRTPDHPVVRATFEPLADLVAGSVEDPGSATVLDVGCGNGFLQRALEHRFAEVVGLDASLPMLRCNPCRRSLGASATRLPFPSSSFDVVVASHLLHHLAAPDRRRALDEMRRVSRRRVVCFEPNRNNPYMLLFGLLKKEERMLLRFTPRYLLELFEQAGLGPATCRIQGWTVPNRAPRWWPPAGAFLDASPLRRWGFDLCVISSPVPAP